MLRDVQKRRMLEQHNQERVLINAVWKNNILPRELRDLAYREIQKHPRDSTLQRINRRCAVTGKATGIFHQNGLEGIGAACAPLVMMLGVDTPLWMLPMAVEKQLDHGCEGCFVSIMRVE